MCSVVGCDSGRRGAPRFRLPEDPERRLEWVQFVLRVNDQCLKESSWTDITVCSEHFSDDCLLRNPAAAATEQIRLKSGAVPSQMEGGTEKWTDSEVRVLLNLYGCEEGRRDHTKKNLRVFASVSEQMVARGFHRSVKQCREKVKKLKQDYKKVKDENIKSGYERKTNKWYEKMDAILGHRPEFAGNGTTSSFSAYGSAESPETGGPSVDTTAPDVMVKEESVSDEGVLNDAPSASSLSSDCSPSSSPCPPSACASPPPRPSTSSSQPSSSFTPGQLSFIPPRPTRKRKREDPSLQSLVKQLLQKDEEDRQASQETMKQLLAMLNEQNAREAEERERQRVEAAEDRRRQDTFHKLLGMLLLKLSASSQQPTHPALD